jgi:signal transduction histidine kinase
LVVSGPDLREADTKAVSIFASQTAIALANVQLYEETRTWAAELEKRVAERTEELASANRELETALARRKQVEEAVRQSSAETLRSHRLLLALSQAAERVQRARTPEEVYQTIGDEVAALGYRVIFLALTTDRTHLFLSYLTIQLAAHQAAEQLSAGLPAQGLQIPFRTGDPFHRIISLNESIFWEQTTERLTKGFADLPGELLNQMMAVLGTERSIYAPLRVDGKPYGLLAVTGPDLTATDLPTITLLANRAAIAIENARLLEQLTAGRQRLQRLARQAVSAQEDERQRLSRALHDEAGQALTALKISLNLIGEDLPRDDVFLHQRIQDASSLTDTVMNRIRLLAQGLRPPALDAVGLNHTLESLCQDFGERIQLPIRYHGMDHPRLSGEGKIVLYRFVQEALTNVAKHASARCVSVELQHDNQKLWLSVADDGRGFDPHASTTNSGYAAGIGLLGMQERIEALGGRLVIESYPGQGSRLVAHIPLREAEVDTGTTHTPSSRR